MTESEELSKVLQVIQDVHKIQRVRWPISKYLENFGKRPVGNIIRSGRVHYMNACMDLTPVCAMFLKEKGFEPTLVVDEQLSPYTQKPTLHFAVEVPVGQRKTPHTIDFGTIHETLLYRGRYNPIKSRALLSFNVSRFPTHELKRSSSVFDLLGIRESADLNSIFRYFTHENMKLAQEAMERSDSPEIYRKARRIKPRIRKRL